jgi:nucleoside-diphosphate-sugar epimerase
MLTSEADHHVLITGGAGYIGSVVTGELLKCGYHITVVDDLLFGGESLLAYVGNPRFHFLKADVCQSGVLKRAVRISEEEGAPSPTAIIHLAAIVGFPACQSLSREAVWRVNVDSVHRILEDLDSLEITRLLFASTYSVYGIAPDGKPVNEEAPLNPQSLYAESKIAAEALLLDASREIHCAPLIYRFSTIFGVSSRMRFDLMINQFVLDAYSRGELLVFHGNYARSFIHIQDVVDGLRLGLDAPRENIRGRIFNLGSQRCNYTKNEIVSFIQEILPEVRVSHTDLDFEQDMRDVRVSFERVERELGFTARRSVYQGINDVLQLLQSGLISDPFCERFRNAPTIVQ